MMRFAFGAVPLFLLASAPACAAPATSATPPATPDEVAARMGAWDGKTVSATMTGDYEDARQEPPPFGLISYYSLPWRAYMDTWPADKWARSLGVGWGGDAKHDEAVAQLMQEVGVRHARVEIGWSNFGWDDDLNPDAKARFTALFKVLRAHKIRPTILLNAHHGVPGPLRGFDATLLQAAQKGDRTVKLQSDAPIRVGYTGFFNLTDYIAAFPLITRIDADGTAHLSAPLPKELPAGRIQLQELKYQPLQGNKLKDGTDTSAPAQETFNGWLKYANSAGRMAREAMGTGGVADSGFDIEVWNELTFGSNFLDINNYFEPKRDYTEPFTYRHTRAYSPHLRPDARLEFEEKGYTALLPMTVDFFNDPKNGFANVRVISGFSNQWPWNSGASLWNRQAGLSKHYYTGTTPRDVSPQTPFGGGVTQGTLDALGNFDGKHDNRDWNTIEAGSNFVPTARFAWPEWSHSSLQTETIQRDLFPDSRRSHAPDWMGRYGRYTHNGDFQTPIYVQTEVNFDRDHFMRRVQKQANVPDSDARFIALNNATNSKHLFRQYAFHAHKGFERIYLFSLNFEEFSLGLLPPSFYRALDANDNKLSPQVRKTVPQGWWAVKWLTQALQSDATATPPTATAPVTSSVSPQITRALRVSKLVEYKPRLVFAGDGTLAHPSRYNRDFFAFMPFQTSASRFVVPYYVAFPNATHVWRPQLAPLDPRRYDMPPQTFDVTIGNLRGVGAKVSAYDPLTREILPAPIVNATATSLTVRLLATDAPRVLTVEEAKPGLLISSPQAKIQGERAIVSWQTNVPVDAASVSYGRDWTSRDAQTVKLNVKPGQRRFSMSFPMGDSPMIACRVRVSSGGITAAWPRWDEDPQGQVVSPRARPIAATTSGTSAQNNAPSANDGPTQLLTAPANVVLTGKVANAARGYNFVLPNAQLAEIGDEHSFVIGKGATQVSLQTRYLENRAVSANDLLPLTSTLDFVRRRRVKLPSGIEGTLVEYTLDANAHPGLTELSQTFLLLPIGAEKRDLLVLCASGTIAAMRAQTPTVKAIFASVMTTPKT